MNPLKVIQLLSFNSKECYDELMNHSCNKEYSEDTKTMIYSKPENVSDCAIFNCLEYKARDTDLISFIG